MSNALVELHCHILPGIDDGAKDLDMSMSLIRKELQDGAAGIVFTPHFYYERISVEQFTARRKAAFLQVSAACGWPVRWVPRCFTPPRCPALTCTSWPLRGATIF